MDEEIVICMDNPEAMKTLCAINDGDCALLYAYASASGGKCRLNDAQLHTGFDDRRMERAKSLLILYKICRPAGAGAGLEEGPGYTAAELLSAQRTDPAFRGLCDYLEQALGRSMRKSEIETLYGIYDKLNMPPDVIMLMINYCRSRGRLSARELEKRAYEWHDKGIVTYTAAADMADAMSRRRAQYTRIMSVFGMSGRAPSESEQKYMSAWLEMGMTEEMIKMAYDRTVMRTGRLQWRYLHKILEDWSKKGYKTRRQVELAEGAAPAPKEAGQPPERNEESVVSYVTRMFEEKRSRREAEQARHLEELRRRSPDFARNEVELGRITVQKAKASLSSGGALGEIEARHRALLSERSAILSTLGLDETYISIPPECPKCKDHGYIGNRMCDCFKRACIAEEQRRKRLDVK